MAIIIDLKEYLVFIVGCLGVLIPVLVELVRKRKRLLIFSAIILIVIMMIGTGKTILPFIRSDTVIVPDVISYSQSDSIKKLKGMGLVVELNDSRSYSVLVEKDKVLNQSIKEGTIVKKGDIIELTVSKGTANINISMDEELSIREGESIAINYSASSEDNSDLSFQWSSNNNNIVEISKDGVITGLHVGKTEVTVKVKGGENTKETSAKCVIEVKSVNENNTMIEQNNVTTAEKNESDVKSNVTTRSDKIKSPSEAYYYWKTNKADNEDMNIIVNYVKQKLNSSDNLTISEMNSDSNDLNSYFYVNSSTGYAFEDLDGLVDKVLSVAVNNQNNNHAGAYHLSYDKNNTNYYIRLSMLYR